MAFKLMIFTALIATIRAGAIGYSSPPELNQYQGYQPPLRKVVYSPAPGKAAYQNQPQPEHYDTNPQYSFTYNVQDGLTGDNKSQYETREGDVVKGSYSVIEADGTKRTVEYTADPKNGFNAVVHREPATAKVVAPSIVGKVAQAQAAPVHSYYN